jgi:hypothetical protein
MTGDGSAGGVQPGDDEAHLAALLAVLTAVRADEAEETPLQQWRARRLAALSTANRRA